MTCRNDPGGTHHACGCILDSLDAWRALGQSLLALELTVLPKLKGKDEADLRAVIWKAHDLLKGKP